MVQTTTSEHGGVVSEPLYRKNLEVVCGKRLSSGNRLTFRVT
jgi:hypothetical protein